MRKRIRLHVVISFLAISLLSTAQPQIFTGPVAPTPSPDTEKRYSLSGTVVNSVTGEPIGRAFVILSGQQQAQAMTDSGGRFEFNDLPAGQVNLSVQKPGFFTQQQIRSSPMPTNFQVGPEAASPTLKLVPEGIITGRVVDSDGFPIFRMAVRAMIQRISSGRRQWQQSQTVATDVNGEYRLYNLQPGSYYLVVGPGRRAAMVTAAGDEALESGFPEEVYPTGAGGNNSPSLKLAGGQELHADFTMRSERFFSITGSIAGLPPGTRGSVMLVSNSPAREARIGAPADPETGVFQLPRVPRGDYTLQARAEEQQNGMMGSIPISVKSNINGLQVPLQSMLKIPIHVKVERTKDTTKEAAAVNPRALGVQFMPLDPMQPPAYPSPEDPKDPSSPMILRGVQPGRYHAMITSGFGGSTLYVASARFGDTDLLSENLTITTGSTDAIEVVMRDDVPTLKLKVHSDTELPMAAMMFVPEKGEPTMMQLGMNSADRRRGTSNLPESKGLTKGSDGDISYSFLRPGRYTVLAFDTVDDLEYLNRDALAPYFSRGARVTLTAGQETTASVNVIMRGGE